jgi:DNA-binding IclR family transcriptional regulator
VVLSFASEDIQKQVLASPLRSFSKLSIVDPGELKARLAFVVENYYEVAINENGYGIATLAAPVFADDGRLAAAVAVVGSSLSITKPPDEALLAAVQACAADISAELNSSAWEQWRAARATAAAAT